MVRKTVTLVFCDVADSTPLGERLDPEALRGVWSRYHETAREVLERHGGTIEKFVGDAVLAVFGIPLVHEDDALRAVRAAVELREALAELNDELESAYGVRIAVRTGVNTGEVFAGDPAQGDPFATGDAVVIAQRLEATAAGGEILVGDATLRLVRDAVSAEQVPPLTLKGKSEPVAAWRLLEVEPGAAGLLRRMDSPLVGRAAELARLREEFERADAERSCRIVTVLGEPGVGKSRLAAELVASLGEPTRVLEGRCLPYGSGITYWPLVEIVGQFDLEQVLEGEPDGETVRQRVLEAVGRAEPTSRSDELYWAVRRLLETLAREQPLVLVLDDVQWAEPAFLDLIEYLAGWSRDAPILVCCLARTDLAELRPAWAATATIELAPLAREDVRLLLENLAGPLDPAAADAVGRATGGNPLFLEEMLRMLVEDGVLVERDGRLRSLVELDSVRVPETVQAVLAARLDRLDSEELGALQRAAVIGQVFWWGAVADLTPRERTADVSGRLQALVRKGFIRPDRSTFAGEDGFRFGHILIRDSAYESMPKRLRGELHEQFAVWVERTGRGAELDEIRGHHLEQAYFCRIELGPAGHAESALAAQAADCLARAGRRALARADAHAAVSLLERAVALLADDSGERLELLLDMSVALHLSGRLAHSIATLDELLTASPPTQLEWSARLERALVVLYTGEGSPDQVLEIAEQAAAIFAELGDDSGLSKTWNAVGLELFIRGRYAQMADAAEQGLAHARRAGDERQEAATISALCVALALGPTPAEEAVVRCRELLARAEELGTAATPTAVLASLEAMRGNVAEAWSLYGAAKNSLDDSGSRIPMCALPLYAEPLLALDRERAEAELRPALTMLTELGERGVLPTVAAHLAEILVRDGKLDEAEELTRLSERLTGPTDVATQVVWRRARALALVGRGVAGAELAREAVELARSTDSPHLLAATLVVLAEAGGEPAAAAEAARLWEEKGHLPALATLDIRAQAR